MLELATACYPIKSPVTQQAAKDTKEQEESWANPSASHPVERAARGTSIAARPWVTLCPALSRRTSNVPTRHN